MSRSLQRALAVVALTCCSFAALGDRPCRVAFDMGSSGIRVGTSLSAKIGRVEFDALELLRTPGGVDALSRPVQAALQDLLSAIDEAGPCEKIAGGFSAWRLAFTQDPERLIQILDQVKNTLGIGLLIIPQSREGNYAYFHAKKVLRARLQTSHVLDIGGGSLQVSGEHASSGAMLGQKLWYRELCELLRKRSEENCDLQPMSDAELALARDFAGRRLRGLTGTLRGQTTLTAVSRPLTRGVGPAVSRLLAAVATQPASLQRDWISQAISVLAQEPADGVARRTDQDPRFARYLVSDMLLVEGIMLGAGINLIHLAELDLTNVPGLLQDEQAYSWLSNYPCYLERLRLLGPDALGDTPAACSVR
jgi:hypothetical protein